MCVDSDGDCELLSFSASSLLVRPVVPPASDQSQYFILKGIASPKMHPEDIWEVLRIVGTGPHSCVFLVSYAVFKDVCIMQRLPSTRTVVSNKK